jgi:MFS family permease
MALLAAEVISSLGSLMSAVALPWFVLATTGSPTRMGIVLAAESAPLLVLAVASARVVARVGARGALMICDVAWAATTGAIPVLHFAGALSFPLLVGLAFLSGVPWAAHAGSQSAVIPELLGENERRVAEANALLQTLSRLAYFVGPAVGGVLVAAVGAPTVLLIDAASFVVSFVVVATLIPLLRGTPAEATPTDVAGGLDFIRRDAWMRPLTTAQALSQGAFRGMTTAIPVLAFAAYDRDARLAGTLLAVWGGGAMIGSIAALRVVRSSDPFKLGAGAWACQALPLWGIVVSRSPGVAACALAASGIANGLRVPPITGITMRRVPQRMRAETLTAASSVVLGAGFIALLVAGPALDHLGALPVWSGIAAIQTAAALIFARLAWHTTRAERAPSPGAEPTRS